jgi:hypothetical protein
MTFRKIDLAGFTPAVLADQPAPSLLWAEIASLVIDERYQRGLTPPGRRAIQRMADGWDWTKYQPILIAATPDGCHAVVDGQHRAHAAALAGLERLPAMIVPMTPAAQAQAFAAVNTSAIRLSGAALFKARLAGGDARAVAAADAVARAGCRLMTYTPSASQRRPGDIFTHALIEGMVEAGEGAAVEAGLRAIRESAQGSVPGLNWGEGTRVWDAAVLRVWLPALAANQRFLRLPLAEVFDGIDWDAERDTAAVWARQTGRPVRAILAERVTAILRAALDDRVAA